MDIVISHFNIIKELFLMDTDSLNKYGDEQNQMFGYAFTLLNRRY